MSKKIFLIARYKLEFNISNWVKNNSGNDLFDWINLIILFGGGSAFLLYLLIDDFIKLDTFLQGWILWFTSFVLVRYTKETYWLKNLAQKQNITSIRPYLRLQKKTGENKLQLVNEGKGVAVNLQSVYKNNNQDEQLPYITAMAAAPNSVTEGLTPARLGINFDSDEDCLIEIKYKDIEARNYHAIFKRNSDYNDKFEIMEQKEI